MLIYETVNGDSQWFGLPHLGNKYLNNVSLFFHFQLYESERTASDLLRKELQQLKEELNKMRSDVEVVKAVATANETSARRTDAMIAVNIHLIFICACVCMVA